MSKRYAVSKPKTYLENTKCTFDSTYPFMLYLKKQLEMAEDKVLEAFQIKKSTLEELLNIDFDEGLLQFYKLIDNDKSIKLLRSYNMTDKEINEYGVYAHSIFERLWLINNSLLFVIDINKAKKLPKVTKEEVKNINFEAIKNSNIALSSTNDKGKLYLPMYLDYFDTDYLKAYGDTRENIYKFRLHSPRNIKSKHWEIDEIYNFSFTESKLPILFKENNWYDSSDLIPVACENCPNRHFKTNYTFDLPYKGLKEVEVCHLSKTRQSQCNCFENAELTADVALAIIVYISKMYEKRQYLLRKNSSYIKEYSSKGEFEMVCSKETTEIDKKDFEEVSLIAYAKQENYKDRKYYTRCNITHSHHASPREHFRKAHTRIYKSGKVVNVKEAIINKGKGKVIYRVD